MNESDFEKSLRTFRPCAPSNNLEAAIAGELSPEESLAKSEPGAHWEPLSPSPERPDFLARIFARFGWALVGAAAAIALLAFFPNTSLPPQNFSAPAEVADFEAVGITHELVAAEDGGLLLEDDEEPARLVRYTTLERHAWTNPSTGARLEVEVPREDLVLMPVAMQ